eukprot:3771616-Rhodomonas_salina.1
MSLPPVSLYLCVSLCRVSLSLSVSVTVSVSASAPPSPPAPPTAHRVPSRMAGATITSFGLGEIPTSISSKGIVGLLQRFAPALCRPVCASPFLRHRERGSPDNHSLPINLCGCHACVHEVYVVEPLPVAVHPAAIEVETC